MTRPKDRGIACMVRGFCLATFAATALLGHGAHANTAQDSRVVMPNEEFTALTALADVMVARLQRVRQRYDTLRERLVPIPDASRQDMLAALKKNQQLARAVARLEAMFGELAPARGAATSIPELQKAAAEAQSRRDEWVRKQAQADSDKGSASAAIALPQESSVGDMEAITVKLVKNRVVPLNGDFFTARAARGRLPSGELVPVRVISRVRDGEAVADALREGGLMDTLLGKADARRKYVRILVCADSVVAYRRLASHVAKRGFAYSWDTSKDQDLIQRSDRTQASVPATDSGLGVYRAPQ